MKGRCCLGCFSLAWWHFLFVRSGTQSLGKINKKKTQHKNQLKTSRGVIWMGLLWSKIYWTSKFQYLLVSITATEMLWENVKWLQPSPCQWARRWGTPADPCLPTKGLLEGEGHWLHSLRLAWDWTKGIKKKITVCNLGDIRQCNSQY